MCPPWCWGVCPSWLGVCGSIMVLRSVFIMVLRSVSVMVRSMFVRHGADRLACLDLAFSPHNWTFLCNMVLELCSSHWLQWSRSSVSLIILCVIRVQWSWFTRKQYLPSSVISFPVKVVARVKWTMLAWQTIPKADSVFMVLNILFAANVISLCQLWQEVEYA